MKIKSDVKSLYAQGKTIKEIAALTGEVASTLYSRRQRENWDAEREPKKRSKKAKNSVDALQLAQLREIFQTSLAAHQKVWYQASKLPVRMRNILKSRQIGATWYFAREALLDALETGRNQIFLSASRSQALQFRRFILFFAREVEVELRGDPIVLANNATLYFLGTSAATAQSYTGNLYFDEYFWTANFVTLRAVASGMASQKGLRQTYFSTASSEEHDGYLFWSGELYNRGRKKSEQVAIDISHSALAGGQIGADNQWRQIVTAEDAVSSGFALLDIAELQAEKSAEEFANLYQCQFLTRGEKPFSYSELLACAVDIWEGGAWPDYQPYAMRPLGNTPVWVGYDPNGESEGGDSAGLAVIAPPSEAGGKFRILEALQLRGTPFEQQAEALRQVTLRYNVTFIGIDGTGIGGAVHTLVCKFFPQASKIIYTHAVKTALVLKAQMVIRRGRLEYDASLTLIAKSFLTIRKTFSQGGLISYSSERSLEASHGDIAWAVMHALQNEPIGEENGPRTRFFLQEF